VGAGQVSREQTKNNKNNKKQQKQQKQQKALAWLLRNCSTYNISLNSVFVNVLYPPHEHIFAKGVFHGIYPSSN
jgi:hypothetical protein